MSSKMMLRGHSHIGPEDGEHKLVLVFFGKDNWEEDFELELDGHPVTLAELVMRFGRAEVDVAIDTAHEEGCFHG